MRVGEQFMQTLTTNPQKDYERGYLEGEATEYRFRDRFKSYSWHVFSLVLLLLFPSFVNLRIVFPFLQVYILEFTECIICLFIYLT